MLDYGEQGLKPNLGLIAVHYPATALLLPPNCETNEHHWRCLPVVHIARHCKI